MTDFEILMGESPKAAPLEIKKYSDWSKTAPPAEDDIQNRKAFSDYIREEYLKADQYSVDVESEIRDSLRSSLVENGLVEEGDTDTINSLYAAKERPFDNKVDLIQSSIDFKSDPDWETITRYKALAKIDDPTVETSDKLEQSRLQVEQIVANRFDDVKRSMVHNGELAFAFVKGEDGEQELIAGDRATKSDFLTAIKDSKIGGVQLSDAFIAQQQIALQEGTDIPRYKYKRLREAHAMMTDLVKEDQLFRYQVSGHGTRVAAAEYDNNDRWQFLLNDMGQDISDAAGWLIGKVTGGDQDERTAAEREKRAAIGRAGNVGFDEATQLLAKRLNSVGEGRGSDAFTLEEVQSAYKQLILDDANSNNKFEFHDEDDEVGKNIRTYGYLGPVVHPAAMANEEVFNKMLAARPDVDDSVKDTLKKSRVAFLESNFSGMSDLLLRSGKADEWSEALTKGRATDKKNHEILSDYLSDEDNYSKFAEGAKGIAWSLWDSVTQLAAAVPAAFGAEWAQNTLMSSARRNSDRREVANLFGEEFGFVQDIGETIAPLLVDVAATATLATVTAPAAGAGGAAYLAARQGARLTAKGFGKALTSSVFRTTGTEGAEKAAQKLLTENLIKQSIKDGGSEGASAAIKGYNSLVAQRFGIASASFIPAATRSGGATYGTLFNELSKSTDLSREEIHDRALGGALVAGAFTGFITAGFGALGRGGVEDALLKGMPFKDLSKTLKSIANTKGIDDTVVANAFAKVAAAQQKLYKFAGSKSLLGNAKDEAIEEGLDEFINGFVTDAVLSENTPMLDRMSQSLYAGMLGGVMGAGAPAIRKVAEKVRPNKFNRAAQAAKLARDFDEQVAQELENTGSPLTADAVRNRRRQAARERGEFLPRDPEAEAATAAPAPEVFRPIQLEMGDIERRFPDNPPLEQLQKVAQEVGVSSSVEEGLDDVVARAQLAQRIIRAEKRAELDTAPEPETEAAPEPEEAPFAKERIPLTPAVDEATKKAAKERAAKKAAKEGLIPLKPAVDGEPAVAETAPEAVGLRPPQTLFAGGRAREAQADAFVKKVDEALNTDEGQAELQRAISNFDAKQDLLSNDTRSSVALDVNPEVRKDVADLTYPLASQNKEYVAGLLGVDVVDLIVRENSSLSLNDYLPKQDLKFVKQAEVRTAPSMEGIDVSETGDFDLSPFKTGATISDTEKAEAMDYAKLAVRFGVPVRVTSDARFGLPKSKGYSDKSDFLAKVVYDRYPIIPVDAVGRDTFKSSRKKTYFDPVTGKKKVDGRLEGVLDDSGRVIFNNDPVMIAEMLSNKQPVLAPEEGAENINPAFKIVDDRVVDVFRPSLDGNLKESLITPIQKSGSLELNHDLYYAQAGVPFIKDFDKVLPAGAMGVSIEGGKYGDVSLGGQTIGDLDQQLRAFDRAYRNDEASFNTFFTTYGGAQLRESAPDALQAAFIEMRLSANLFELRTELLKEGSGLTETIGNNLIVAPSKKKRVVKTVLSRMKTQDKKTVAGRLKPLVSTTQSKSPTNSEVIIQFVEEQVLNNSDFDGNNMPTFSSLLSRSVGRYVSQEKSRGIHESERVITNMTDEAARDAAGLANAENQALYLGGPVGETVSPQVIPDVVARNTNDAVSAIDEDPELREALSDIAFQSLYPDPDPEMVAYVTNMETPYLLNKIGGWMAANPTSREVVEFVNLLEGRRGIRFRSGSILATALKGNGLGSRVDGDPTKDNDQILYVTEQLKKVGLAQEPTREQAINFIKSIDGPVRRLMSKSHLTEAERQQAEIDNARDMERLGLVSGDPESVVKALTQIANTSSNPNHKLVAEMLLEDPNFIRNVRFATTSSPLVDAAGEYHKGKDGTHRVIINLAQGNGRGLENVLLEEYLHATTADIIAKDESLLTKRQRLAKQRLQGLKTLAEKQYEIDRKTLKRNPILEDGFVNLEEFVASIMLSPDFQQHIRSLATPRGERGFFQRIVDAIASFFRKVTKREGRQFAQAIEDVVSLGPKKLYTVKASMMSTVAHKAAEDAKANAQRRSEVSEDSLTGREIAEEPTTQDRRQEGPARPLDQEPDVAAAIEESNGEAATSEEQEVGEEIILFLKSIMPLGSNLRTDKNQKGPIGARGLDVIINVEMLLAELSDMDTVSQKRYVQSLVNEELAHVASYGFLTQQDINTLISGLSNADFDAIIEEYHSGIDDSQSRQATIEVAKARIQSEDPKVSQEAKTFYTEEKLRMTLQRATRGFTTEEDRVFYRSSPSMLSILTRYFSGVLRSFRYQRNFAKGRTGPIDAAAFSLINELAAVQMGMSRTSAFSSLDTDAPAAAIEDFKNVSAEDALEEIEENADEVDAVMTLAASGLSDKALKVLQDASGQRMEDGTRFIAAEATAESPQPAQETVYEEEDIEAAREMGLSVEDYVAAFSDTEVSDGLDKLKETVESLSDETMLFELYADSDKFDITINPVVDGQPQAGYAVDGRFSDGLLEIGTMFPQDNADISLTKSLSLELMRALIFANGEIGAPKIQTFAGGSGVHRRNAEVFDSMVRSGLGDILADEFGEAQSEIILNELSFYLNTYEKIGVARNPNPTTGYSTWFDSGFKTTRKSQREFKIRFNRASQMTDEQLADERQFGFTEDDFKAALIRSTGAPDSVERLMDTFKETDAFEAANRTRDRLRKDFAELRELISKEDDDLSQAWHGIKDPQTKKEYAKRKGRVKNLWKLFGFPQEVEFDLKSGSDSLRIFTQKNLIHDVLNRPEVRAITKSFNDAVKKLGALNPEEAAEVLPPIRDEHNNRLHEAGVPITLFASARSRHSANSGAPLSKTDFRNVVRLLEMPQAEFEAFKAPKGFFRKLFKGEVSDSVRAVIEQRDEFKRASGDLGKRYKKTLDKLMLAAFGPNPSDADIELLAQAQGFIDGNLVGDDTLERIEAAHLGRLQLINANASLTKAQKDLESDKSKEIREKEIRDAEDAAIAAVKTDRDNAIALLREKSPKLAAHIMDMRNQLIIPLGKKLKKEGALADDIGVKIDRNGGIYLTRAYQIFTDPTYATRVREDPAYASAREAAAKFFRNQFVVQTQGRLMEEGMTEDQARKEALAALRREDESAAEQGSSFGDLAVRNFLSRYDDRSNIGQTRGMRVLHDNLQRRADLPKELRTLLGELGPETGTDLIVRTLSTVTAFAAQQNFLNTVKKAGQEGGWVVEASEYNEEQHSNFVRVRANGTVSQNDPLATVYMDREVYEGMKTSLEIEAANKVASTSEQAVGTLASVAQKLTGGAMVAKTLGSVGFYLRNLLGNVLFFGPAQGYGRLDKMLSTSLKHTFDRLKNADQVDSYLTELIGLGVVGDEVRAGIMRELLDGKAKPESFLEKADELTDAMAIVSQGKKSMKWLQDKAIDLSAGVDGGFKIALFEHELNVLVKAFRKHPDSGPNPNTEEGMYQIKRMAARKVKMTAQSLSQAPPIVTDLSRSQFGILFAPFIRFKTEVPRIVVNTYKLGFEERRSGNPVLKRRGTQRIAAMSTMLGGVSTTAAAVLAQMAGVGEDEDEALRKSMPSYLRGHSFFFFRDKDGNLKSLDLTYLNPFSLLADPVMRSLSQIKRGNFAEAGAALAKGAIFDQYLDEQILAGSVSDVLANRDATTDRSIWTPEVDGVGEAMGKSLAYIFKGAYEPRVLKDALEARQAAGGDYSEFSDSPLGQFLDGTYPVKVHSVDLQQQYRRFLRDHVKRVKVVNDKKYRLYSKQAVGEDEIRDIYDAEVEGRRALNAELLRVSRGFDTLGMSTAEQYRYMVKGGGVGKSKAQLLLLGAMDRPAINKGFAEGLYQRNLQHRLQPLLDQMSSYNRYLLIEDPE